MALNTVTAIPLPENLPTSFTVSNAHVPIMIKASEGDVLVCLTENHQVLGAFYVESIQYTPNLRWSVRTRDGAIFESGEAPLHCHSTISLQIPHPIKIYRTKGGYKTLMLARIPENCSIHSLSYLEHQQPEIYRQLRF